MARALISLLSSLILFTLALAVPLPANAGPLPWRDDPFSGLNFSNASVSTTGPNGNTRVFRNLEAVNFSSQPLPRLLVMAAWFWPFTAPVSMTWSNALDGWFTDNYDGTSLLVNLDNAAGRIRFGDVAGDPAGLVPIDPMQAYLGVSETRASNDQVPFLDLGSFAPNEAKSFDLAYTFHFGDNRMGNPGAAFFLNTLSPSPSAIPEPSSLSLTLTMGLFGFLLVLRRRRVAAHPF